MRVCIGACKTPKYSLISSSFSFAYASVITICQDIVQLHVTLFIVFLSPFLLYLFRRNEYVSVDCIIVRALP